jgi:hypothetical protein
VGRRAGHRGAIAWQVLGVLAVWAFVLALHWNNDGLWYQGDSSRHAANGLFWWDFLDRVPTNPLGFALAYYARYPVINPTSWPPLFYLLEGAAYRVFGVSPFVAKSLVLLFVLVGTLYLLAWLRRWVGPSAGWAALLLPLQPGIVEWGHAVMLNVPSMVLAVAALYHWRRWLEAPRSRHLEAAAALAAAAVLTYIAVAVIAFVMLAWALAEGRGRALIAPRTLLVGMAAAVPVAAWALVGFRWAPTHRAIALYAGDYPPWKVAGWIYYPEHFFRLVTVPLLLAALLALGLGLWRGTARRELRLLLLWFAVCYAWFSIITIKEARYVLLLVPPLVVLGAVGIREGLRLVAGVVRRPAARLVPAALLAMLVLHVGLAAAVPVRRVEGFREIVEWVDQVVPTGRVFYDGFYSGVFTFYLRREDPDWHRAVTLGSKLLYGTKISPRFGLVEHVHAVADVRSTLAACGCRYLIVERELSHLDEDFAAVHLLRAALRGPGFRLVRSFPVQTGDVTDVDVYEMLDAPSAPALVDLRFPVLGDGVHFEVSPIQR